MVDFRLVEFVHDSLKRGFTFAQIRAYLIQYGWPQQLVDEAIRYSYSQTVDDNPRPSSHLRHSLIVFGFIVVVLVSVGLIALLMGGGADDTAQEKQERLTPNYNLSVDTSRVEKGGTLVFTNTLSYPGEGLEGYTIYPTYRIFKSRTGSAVMRWDANRGVPIVEQKTERKSLGSNLETGSYYIKAEAWFKGSTVSDTAEFLIYEESAEPTCSDGEQNQGEEGVDCGGPCEPCPNCSDGEKNQGEAGVDCGGPCEPCEEVCETDCNDYNPCTEDKCVEGECVHEPKVPCCGNMMCEENETPSSCPADCEEDDTPPDLMDEKDMLDKARTLAENSEHEAGEFCHSVSEAERRDECFRIVAYKASNKEFCGYVNATNKRDSCYLEFAMEERDYSVCSKIENAYLKDSCEALKGRPEAKNGR